MGLVAELCGPELAPRAARSGAVSHRRSEALPTPGPYETGERHAPDGAGPGWGSGAPAAPAGLGPRAVATLVDAVIVVVAWFVALWLFLELLTLTGAFDQSTFQSASLDSMTLTSQQYGLALFAGGILVALRGAYLVYAWVVPGRTPGQQLLGLVTADARTGGRLALPHAIVRWVVSELPGVAFLMGIGILVWYGAIALSTARGPTHRGLHDVVAGSVVLRRPREATGSRRVPGMTGPIDPTGQASEPQEEAAPPSPSPWQTPPPGPGVWQGPPPPAWTQPPVQAGPAAGIVYAGFGVRLVAYIMDAILLAIVETILGAIVVGTAFAAGTIGYGSLIGLAVINLVLSGVYFIYSWTRMRASPGDRLLGIMVLNAADGSPLTTNQAAMRWLVLAGPGALATLVSYGAGAGAIISLLVFLWYIYLAWSTATDPKRQGFHDKYVQSVVVKAALR